MYDFDTLITRYNIGSGKWDRIKQINPNIGDDVIPFSVADMEFKNAPEIIDGLKEYLDSVVLGYTGATDAYYGAVTRWMERRHGFSPKRGWFVLSPGVVPAINDMVGAFTKDGDSVLITPPVYYPFRGAIEGNKRNVVESELVYCDGTYTIDFDDFESKAKREDVTLFIMCSPHNPIGRIWTKEELLKVCEICLENNVFIICDEIHSDIIMPGQEMVSLGTFEEKYLMNCAICTAPSKTFSLAGLQTSNIFIPDEKRREMVRNASGYHSLNMIGLKACELAYDRAEKWCDEMCEYVYGNYCYVRDFIAEKLPQLKVIELQGTYLLWVDCRALGMDAKALEEFMQQKAQFFLDEGYVFGNAGEGFERISLSCPRRYVEYAMDRLYKAVQNL